MVRMLRVMVIVVMSASCGCVVSNPTTPPSTRTSVPRELAGAPGQHSPSTSRCAKDTDCVGDLVCDSGACQAPTVSTREPAPWSCSMDRDCPGDLICEARVCREVVAQACGSDKDCAGESICENGVCSGAELPPSAGQIDFSSQISSATAYVDGLVACTTPCSLTVEPGDHVAGIGVEGLVIAEVRLRVQAGARHPVRLTPTRRLTEIDLYNAK